MQLQIKLLYKIFKYFFGHLAEMTKNFLDILLKI